MVKLARLATLMTNHSESDAKTSHYLLECPFTLSYHVVTWVALLIEKLHFFGSLLGDHSAGKNGLDVFAITNANV